MVQKIYVGVDGKARKVKKLYFCVNGKPRKVKKVYIGIGGRACPCFTSKKLAYYGTATPLSVARDALAATTVGSYALFGGGESNTYSAGLAAFATVNAYNSSLTRSTPTALSKARYALAATAAGGYALFGGGVAPASPAGFTPQAAVDAYNASLTRSTPTALSKSRYGLAATTVGSHALFGGGQDYSINVPSVFTTVDAYNASLVRSAPTALSVARSYLAATAVGSYALFGGGMNDGNSFVTMDAYNASLTRSTPTALSEARYDLSSTTVGGYALFGAGGSRTVVDAYDASLTRSIPAALSTKRTDLVATTVGDYALFAGKGTTVVDVYDFWLTKSITTALSISRSDMAATTVGDFALFGGGDKGGGIGSSVATVDVYTA